MHRGTWWASVHRVAKSQTQLKRLNMHAHTHTHACTHKWIKRTNQNRNWQNKFKISSTVYKKSLSRVRLFVTPCPTLCDPVDCSLPGSSLHGILQARILEWVAISFLKGSSRPRDRTRVTHIACRRFNL